MRAVRQFVARHRRNAMIRAVARRCRSFLKSYDNLNYRHDTNGERFVLERLQPLGVTCVFDVGANIGDWSSMAAAILPDARIHSFEIVPQTHAALRGRLGGDARYVLNDFGLSDREGEIDIRYFPGDSTVATSTDYPQDLDCEIVTGKIQRGDDYVANHHIDRIGFLKIDVEGGEPEVLKGLSRNLEAGTIDVIQFEYGKVSILTKFLLRDFYALLEGHGYAVGKIFPNYVDFRAYELDMETFIGPNYLAVRRERDDIISSLV